MTPGDVVRAIHEYDRLGADRFFAEHGFAPATTYELVWDERRYPPKAILGTAYEFATGQRLLSTDFEGGKAGAVRCSERLDSPSNTNRADPVPWTAFQADVLVVRSSHHSSGSRCVPRCGPPALQGVSFRRAVSSASSAPRATRCPWSG